MRGERRGQRGGNGWNPKPPDGRGDGRAELPRRRRWHACHPSSVPTATRRMDGATESGRARERSRGALVTRVNRERTESLDGMERPERKQSRLLPPSTDPILSRPHSVRRWHRTGGQPGIHPGEEEGLGAKVGRRPQRAATEKSSLSATRSGSREELSLPTLPGCGRRTGRVAQPR